MRVSIQRSTGKLIEAQDGGDNLQVLIDNAVSSGIPASDVEAKFCTFEEYRALLPVPVVIDASDVDNAPKILKAACIYFGQLLGKTPAQVKAGIKTVYASLP